MRAIYEPTGRAKEYSELACNLYNGCSFGCTYCYAPAVMRMTPEQFSVPRPRNGVIESLNADCIRLKRLGEQKKHVLFCFTCDPYQPIDAQHHLMRSALEVLRRHRIPPRILTKSDRAEADFDLLSVCVDPEFGMTLTHYNDDLGRFYEPRASSTHSRFKTLYTAKNNYGIRTWVSLEPIIKVEETVRCIEWTHEFVDYYKVGKWNHSPEATGMDWVSIRQRVIGVLEDYGCVYTVKKDLREAR